MIHDKTKVVQFDLFPTVDNVNKGDRTVIQSQSQNPLSSELVEAGPSDGRSREEEEDDNSSQTSKIKTEIDEALKQKHEDLLNQAQKDLLSTSAQNIQGEQEFHSESKINSQHQKDINDADANAQSNGKVLSNGNIGERQDDKSHDKDISAKDEKDKQLPPVNDPQLNLPEEKQSNKNKQDKTNIIMPLVGVLMTIIISTPLVIWIVESKKKAEEKIKEELEQQISDDTL
jgi:hypothetical protein